MATFRYTYRTSDGSWHEATLEADSRDAVFSELNARGIRPVKVWCPNPPRFRLSKRWTAIGVLLIVSVSLALTLVRRGSPAPLELRSTTTLPRHRILSAPNDFAARIPALFGTDAERFLAYHAQPGLLYSTDGASLADLRQALEAGDSVSPNDPDWVIELKGIVSGMKVEAGLLLKSGKSEASIALWIAERQKMEATYRNQIMLTPGTQEEKARRLRTMGL